jgi:hypothetical protein
MTTTITAIRVERIREGRFADLARQHGASCWTCVCATAVGPMRVIFATIAREAELAACSEADKYARQLAESHEYLPVPSSRKCWIFDIQKEATNENDE